MSQLLEQKRLQKLEEKKEKLEEINDSFDFAKHDHRALNKVNSDIRTATRSQAWNQVRQHSKLPIRFALIAIVLAGAIHFTYATRTNAGSELHQVAPGQSVNPTPPATAPMQAKPVIEQDTPKAQPTGANEPEFLKQLKQSENYKKNEALAKKLASAHCTYKTTKQGDFYVCDFNGEK